MTQLHSSFARVKQWSHSVCLHRLPDASHKARDPISFPCEVLPLVPLHWVIPGWSPWLHRGLVVAIHLYIPASLPDEAQPIPLHVPTNKTRMRMTHDVNINTIRRIDLHPASLPSVLVYIDAWTWHDPFPLPEKLACAVLSLVALLQSYRQCFFLRPLAGSAL